MAIPSLDDVLEIAIVGEFDGTEEVVNVMQFQVEQTSVTTEANLVISLLELVEALLDVWEEMATAVQIWKRFRWRNLTTSGPSQTVELAADHPGVIAGDSEPPGVAGLLGFYTSESGVVLRKFLGPSAQSLMTSDGEFSGSAIGYGAAILALMVDPIVVYQSTYRYGHTSGITLAWLTPTSGYMSTEPAYQRRRRRGKGS